MQYAISYGRDQPVYVRIGIWEFRRRRSNPHDGVVGTLIAVAAAGGLIWRPVGVNEMLKAYNATKRRFKTIAHNIHSLVVLLRIA
ncbi:hypothetical protein MK632_09095 [Rhizobium changzhiense]|uniref:hypothetical protein n=1 Tax=Rhizobium changzhiense TaxID=2692317 RepID=UPI001F0BF472|nr:hypothetical protein [Rhizobium changzhiense]MCH4545926.1 hypothetical protein [Rhizobium changzhiense]